MSTVGFCSAQTPKLRPLSAGLCCATPAFVELDEELVWALGAKAKKQIRQRMRGLRRALPASVRRAKSELVCSRLAELQGFREASRIALFSAIEAEGELDLAGLDRVARAAGKAVSYPFLERTQRGTLRTGFRFTDSSGDLVESQHGFLQPAEGRREAAPQSLHFIVVPAVAVASDGTRLGFGSGFYDATLPEFCPPGVAVAAVYQFQLLSELPREDHDVRCALLVTEEATLSVV